MMKRTLNSYYYYYYYSWFCANRLAVNPSKTEYFLIGTNQQRSKVMNSSVCFQNLFLIPTDSVRNLGVIFDANLDFKKHISSICRSSFFPAAASNPSFS